MMLKIKPRFRRIMNVFISEASRFDKYLEERQQKKNALTANMLVNKTEIQNKAVEMNIMDEACSGSKVQTTNRQF